MESGNDYTQLQDALVDCDYISVVRKVNKIFFDIFSGKKRNKNYKFYDILFKIMWISLGFLIAIILTLPYYTIPNEEIILSVMMGVIVVMLIFVTISTYLNVPSSNNQMEQSIEDTRRYFEELNRKNEAEGKQYEWTCP